MRTDRIEIQGIPVIVWGELSDKIALSKRIRQYLGIFAAVISYYIIHDRRRDGKVYWLAEKQPTAADLGI